jgi:uncharacterized protein YuzE
MELTYDPETDTAYLYLRPHLTRHQVTSTTAGAQNATVLFDWDGPALVGIEFLSASNIVPQALLSAAKV